MPWWVLIIMCVIIGSLVVIDFKTKQKEYHDKFEKPLDYQTLQTFKKEFLPGSHNTKPFNEIQLWQDSNNRYWQRIHNFGFSEIPDNWVEGWKQSGVDILLVNDKWDLDFYD